MDSSDVADTRHSPPSPGRRRRRRKKRSRAGNLVWAAVFFLLGVIGILIPILPQIPFFVMSLFFLSLVFPGVRRAMRNYLRRHPRVERAYRKWRDKGRRRRRQLIAKEREFAARMRREA
jgi:UPF0716 family protein affecting phage T7 exclusion